MLRGYIKGGSLKLALKLLSIAKESNRVLDTGVYAKLILELGKDPDKSTLVLVLLEELAVRDDLNLTPQDCNAIMKICIRLGRFEIVEGLYDWFRKSGGNPSVVMMF
uniref:Pentacotripeptide-repeat region of PRORP domain-containing protein n=1 Tax=Solanum lycopersicum TaxID=4081 RepID=A0A494G9K5_SOLLC